MSLSRTINTPEIGGGLGQESAPRLHVLDLDDFSREEITEVLESARGMKEVLGRDIKKVPALRGKVVVTLFYEASTRTGSPSKRPARYSAPTLSTCRPRAAAPRKANRC